METITYEVQNISCNHCVHTIQMELSGMKGVEKVVADAASKMVTVSFSPPATRDGIKTLLAEINYPVTE
jgi:copper chaperone